MKTHVFARNTTPLFGAGLIDQIPESALWQLTKKQRSDNEVSGRPGTLSDGTVGKFGWRANFSTLQNFNENACSVELGLQSKRVPQPKDLANLAYANPNLDISNEAIVAMTMFVASLPRPVREIPTDSHDRQRVALGEQRFEAVGCAKCHVPSLASVHDLYSDLLLHDMGPYAIDLAGAPPYIRNVGVTDELVGNPATETQTVTYYGRSSGMYITRNSMGLQNSVPRLSKTGRIASTKNRTRLVSPNVPPRTIVMPIGDRTVVTRENETPVVSGIQTPTDRQTGVTGRIETGTSRQTSEILVTQKFHITEHEQTFVNQEWKTPPLWGVRDSAPYMHDGRAETILEAIAMRDGEGRGARNRFLALSYDDQQAILAFLDFCGAHRRCHPSTEKVHST
jgi:hypothetical protein